MTPDDDARPRRLMILVTAAAGLLVFIVTWLLSKDGYLASGLGIEAAQLAAQLCEPPNTDPPGGGALCRQGQPKC